ncbi:MAG: FHA domain-containing protein [Anaerolineae bacterium]|nr:FHA domain-containing protein [Anaerolineae bacterium]
MSGLIVQNGVQAGQTYTLSPGVYFIGRTADNHIVINEQTISKKHARLMVQDQHYILEDLGSSNGTFVNGRRIEQPTYLQSGDQIQVGTTITLAMQGTHLQPLPAAQPQTIPPPIRRQPNYGLIGLVVILLLGVGGGGWYWLQSTALAPATATPEPTATVAATATPLPIMAMNFDAAPTSVDLGECVTLNWQVDNAQEVRLSGEVVPATSSRQVCPRENNQIYRLTALSLAGETEEKTVSLTVRPTPAPPPGISIEFTANETRVPHGECTTLQWEVSHAMSVRLDDKKVSATGQQQICPTEPSTTYVLLVQPLEGELVEQVVIVNVPPTPTPEPSVTPTPVPTAKPRASAPVIDQYMADQYQLNSGACTTLRWSIRNAQIVRIDGNPVANSGSMQVCPSASANTYTLVATGNGSTQASVTLNVNALPTATLVPAANPIATLPPVYVPPAKNEPVSVNYCVRVESDGCYRYHWNVTGIKAIYFNGNPVTGQDSRKPKCTFYPEGKLTIIYNGGQKETITHWQECR